MITCVKCGHIDTQHVDEPGNKWCQVETCPCSAFVTVETLAKVGFEAYNKQAGGKTFDGRPIPPWSEVGDKVQDNWTAAVLAVKDVLDSEWEG